MKYLDKDGLVKYNNSISNKINKIEQHKFATVVFKKKNNQQFTKWSYDEYLTFDTCDYNGNNISNIIYLSNGLITLSDRVKKIDVNVNILASDGEPTNVRYGDTNYSEHVIFEKTTQGRYYLSFNRAISGRSQVLVGIWNPCTISNDEMWTYCTVTLDYI